MRDFASEWPIDTAEVLLEARGLTFAARGRTLVDVPHLSIPQGRSTVILGANGAGKSLLLQLLHGLLRPTRGEVRWQGRELDAPARRAQAMVFQRPVMLRRSVLANLRFALRARGVGRAESLDRAHAALDAAGLSALAARPARLLSGGEQQRLALARALALEPQLLFLDEPTANLDPAATHAIEAHLTRARAAGVTIVLVTHDAGQARRLGDQAVFLDQGRVAEAAPMLQLLDAPRSAPARAWREGRLYLGGA